MTKLEQWLVGGSVFFSIWWLAVNRRWDPPLVYPWSFFLMYLPFFSAVIFAGLSFFIVLFRVVSFNDCKEAAIELQEEIEQAKKYLEKRGLKVN